MLSPLSRFLEDAKSRSGGQRRWIPFLRFVSTYSPEFQDIAGNLLNQQGYQGAFTLFRDLHIKVTKNVDPSTPGLNDPSSWGVRKESDGSISVITVGQVVIPETLNAYKNGSTVSKPADQTITKAGYIPFDTQPMGRHYAM